MTKTFTYRVDKRQLPTHDPTSNHFIAPQKQATDDIKTNGIEHSPGKLAERTINPPYDNTVTLTDATDITVKYSFLLFFFENQN